MKPSHLRRHLSTNRPSLKDKPVDFFLRKRDELKQSKTTIRHSATSVTKAQEASYRASLRIAKAGKPHTIGEELCLPLAKEMTGIMCGEKAAKQLSLVPLSNDTVSRRIQAMANNVKHILVERIKYSPYLSIQLDETTMLRIWLICLYTSDTNIKAQLMRTFCSVSHFRQELQRNTSFSS